MLPDPTLFDEDGVSVTPGWFTHAGTSHAMRTVVRVSLTDRTLPRRSWRALFFSAIPLVLLTGISLWRERMPWWLAFALFTASVLLALTAARYAFVARDRRRLEVLLADGTRVIIERPGQAFLAGVHAALLRAMDWHHGSSAGPFGPFAGTAGGVPAAGPGQVAAEVPDRATTPGPPPGYRARSR